MDADKMKQTFLRESEEIFQEHENLSKEQMKIYERQLSLKKKIVESKKTGQRIIDLGAASPDTLKVVSETIPRLNAVNFSILNPGPSFIRYFLGDVNSLVLSGGPQRRYSFKKEYESFKYKFTLWNLPLALILLFVSRFRVLDTLYQVFLLYFYVTLALRECILIVNGSNIRQWWIWHHYLSIVLCTVMITWASTVEYSIFRLQFMVFSVYNAILMMVQYVYQSRRLYVMTSLGKAGQMDVVSTDTPQVSMLNFLIPLVFGGHAQQALLSLRLGYYIVANGFTVTWQIYACAALFGIIFYGNFYTTLIVVKKKYSMMKKR